MNTASLHKFMMQSCVAFAVRLSRDHCILRPQVPPLSITGRLLSSSLPASASASASFQPSKPPGTHGTPVFPDFDFSDTSGAGVPAGRQRNSDKESVFVVTGANRGIGLQFCKSLIERTRGTVVACCRYPDQASELQCLAAADPQQRIRMLQLDVEDQDSIEQVGKEIQETFDRVDLLLNVAGILGDGKTTPGPERSLSKVDREWLEKTMAVNLIGPVMLSKELIPLMVQRRRRPKAGEKESTRSPAIIVNISARVGSVSDNGLGGWYSYRMSKTALNQATRTMALELKRQNAWSIALHPGTTDTGLSEPFQANVKEGSLFPVEFTVTQLLNLIDSMEEKHSGGFYDWAGQALSY